MRERDSEFIILQQAARRELPDVISDDTIAPLDVFAELEAAGLLDATVTRGESCQIVQVTKPVITHPGRMRLAELSAERRSSSPVSRTFGAIKWILGVAAGIAITLITQWLSRLLKLQ